MNEALIVKLATGIIAGAWPLIVGFRTKQVGLGVMGFILSFIGGLIAMFFLAAPIAFGCGWFLERRARNAESSGVESAGTESPDSDDSTS